MIVVACKTIEMHSLAVFAHYCSIGFWMTVAAAAAVEVIAGRADRDLAPALLMLHYLPAPKVLLMRMMLMVVEVVAN